MTITAAAAPIAPPSLFPSSSSSSSSSSSYFLLPCNKKPSNSLSSSLRFSRTLRLLCCIPNSQPNFFLHELGLSSTDSLRRRIAKLQSLKLTGFVLHGTITRRPDILTSPEFDRFLDFLFQEAPDLHPKKLERILLSVHPHHVDGFIARVQMLVEHGLPKERVAHVINNVNTSRVFDEMLMREFEEMILFLQRFSWPDIIIRRPVLLNLDLQTQLIPRVEFLTYLADGDEANAALLIRKLPGILAYAVKHFESHLQFWRSVGLTREQVFKIALVYPNIFSASRDRKLKPRIEFLTQCDLTAEEIFKFLTKAPTFLSLSFRKNLSIKLGFLVKIGYKHRTPELAHALGATTRTSCLNMQMVIGLLLSYNFSCDDLMTMSKKHPQILQYNYKSLEKKMEFLIEEMERDVGELMAFPAFLGYKLDDRIKHRYEAKKETRGKGMSLNKLLSVSAERFNLMMSSKSSTSSGIDGDCELCQEKG